LKLKLVRERPKMLRAKAVLLVPGILGLMACAVPPPTDPTVLVLPPEGKDLVQFQQEDASCRGYALQQIGYGLPQQAANQNALGSAAVGPAVGAAAGAAGAAGTGAGLLAGSAIGVSYASTSAFVLQQRYDIAYAQCMAASGNSVQAFPVAWPYTPYGYYPYALSAYYGPWLGPPVAFGLFGGFEPRFHHRVFFHHGFHRGGGAGK
jgi:hypothetical protein